MTLDPKIWGPHYWATLHFISSTYDNNPNESIKSTMKTFIQTIPVFLPCKDCQDHAFKFIKESNLDKVISNRKELFLFFFNFHNFVNQRLNKPLFSLENALSKYSISAPKPELHSVFWITSFVIIIMVIMILVKKQFKI